MTEKITTKQMKPVGSALSASIDNSTYVMTLQLKDQNGNNLGAAQTIDLPLETMVVSGSYDDDTKSLILTLENGNTITIPVSGLIAGLQSEITNDNKLDADLVDDSTSTNKFVTSGDITLWNSALQPNDNVSDLVNDAGYLTAHQSLTDLGVTATATELNVLDGITATTTELNYVHGVTSDIQTQINSKQNTLTAGSNITISSDTISATDTTYTGSDGIMLTGTNFTNSGVRGVATGSANGTVSVNTNGTSADVAVKGLGSAAYTESTDYATATQGSKADSALQPNDNVSELVNDAGYLTAHQSLSDLGITATASEINVLDGITASTTELNYVDGVTSAIQTQLDNKQGLLGGGTSGTVLTNSGTAGTVTATTLATVATSGSYTDLSDKPTIGNATLIIQKNGTNVDTFTANATSNKTINITVPTTAADVNALPDSTKYGASITVSLDTTDYKMTTTLKDQDGNTLGSAQVVDFPLESVVVSGSYDDTTKKVVLTLQNGSTIEFSVADLISGLQTEIDSNNMLDADLVDDSTSTNKFVTSSDITTWNGKQDALTAGTNITISSNTISATDTTYTGSDGVTLTGTNFTNSGVRGVATGSTNGTISVNTNGTSVDVAVYGLGSAAYTSSTDYATSAQGALADTSVQPGDLAAVATTGTLDSLSNVNISTPTAGQNLTYDAVNQVWKNTSTSATIAWGGITGTLADQSDLQNALDAKQATITGAATSVVTNNLAAARAVITDGSGKLAASSTTSTELGYVSGVTSSIQTQLGNKVAANAAITGATKCKITYDSKGLVTGGSDLEASDIPDISATYQPVLTAGSGIDITSNVISVDDIDCGVLS